MVTKAVESEPHQSMEVVGEPGAAEAGEVKMVTVTRGPAGAPETPGAVMMVDQAPGLPEPWGTVTVKTTVAVSLGPSGIVTVTTPTELEAASPGTVAVATGVASGPVEESGGLGSVTVKTGTVTVLMTGAEGVGMAGTTGVSEDSQVEEAKEGPFAKLEETKEPEPAPPSAGRVNVKTDGSV